MRVMASKPSGYYLLSLNDDVEAALKDPDALGCILITQHRRCRLDLPPWNLHSLLSYDSWDDNLMSREETDALMMQHGLPPVNAGQGFAWDVKNLTPEELEAELVRFGMPSKEERERFQQKRLQK